jgi:uncharacterized tellurite resistance protein B-like protein
MGLIKNIFSTLKEKYKNSKLTLIDISDENLKKDITEVFIIIIAIDGDISKEEINKLSFFLQEIIYPDKNIEEIGDKIKIVTDSLSSEIGNLKDIYIKLINKLNISLNNKQKKQLLNNIIELIQADEYVDKNERELLKLFREHIKYNYIGIKVEDMPNKCSGCGGGNVVLYEIEEIDRWIKPKQVTERTSSGKTKTRYVNTTYVKEKNYYQCKDCFYKFTETVTKEK